VASIPIKNPKEIDAMRRSGQAVREVLDAAQAFICPGLTTKELDDFVANEIRRRGAKSAFLGYRGFPGTACISVNEEVVHGIGGSRRLQYGDLVKLDVGIFLNGWVGDTAASISVGVVKEDWMKMVRATQESLVEGIAQAIPGNKVGDVSHAIESYVHKRGYSVVRDFVGHGVGRKLHEEPQVPNYGKAGSGPRLKPGMVIAIEPMVNMGSSEVRVLADGWTVVSIDGKPSAHFEHTVLITEGEPEILTCPVMTASK
jgi:methionyl aminopeptidase